ncbi:hypothetical protein ACGFZC_01275 [[Kitasatospora] papulosa]|uniref:hypothetical protein n=1 Tax=[Kitasatospora] papulosa TaxID=1464011 RepID=UPI0037247BB9
MTIQPIETRYAGHRFRSRLEARWAVFFDALGIRWEYEPQGYLVGPGRKPYLPDFWLPRQGLWVEVKGAEEHLDVELMVHAALLDGGLPRPPQPYMISEHEVRLLILGPLGRGVERVWSREDKEYVGFTQPTHSALAFRKGDFFQAQASFRGSAIVVENLSGRVADDSPEVHWGGQGSEWGAFVGAGCLMGNNEGFDAKVAAAYKAAIGSRFEHGRSGN